MLEVELRFSDSSKTNNNNINLQPITPSSTKTNEAGMWSTEATTKTTMNGADYEIENSTATPLHIEVLKNWIEN